MSRVLVVDAKRQPLMPCTPARARILLKAGKAVVLRRFPFTVILRGAKPEAVVAPLRLKIDPGAKTTGMAVLNDATGEGLWAAELTHRGEQVRAEASGVLAALAIPATEPLASAIAAECLAGCPPLCFRGCRMC